MSIDLDRDLRHDTFDGVGDPGVSAADELAGYRAAFAALAATFDRARRGDLETRVPLLPAVPDAERVRWSANHLLDLIDAFTREAGASLTAASEGRFHRAFLAAGMPGSFGEGAQIVDAGRVAMRSAAERLAATQTERLHLADSFETVVLGASEQVAAASTELGATASTLAIAASDAADRAQAAGSTISSLESSSNQIRQVVDLIHQVTAQTKLLALNAAIEAARAGEAGKGFNVVATEVKNLAQQAAVAAQQIETEVSGVAEATRQAGRVIDELRSTVVEIADQVQAISIAVEGHRGHGGNDPLGSDDFTGLAQLAELLRAEVTTFLGVLRG